MAIRNRTILRQEVAFAAGDAAIVDNLPVNPLSFVDITLRGATSVANTLPTPFNMASVLSRIEVLFRGSSIISIAPNDLLVLQDAMGWLNSGPGNSSDTGLDRWFITLRVSFSRMPFWFNEGFPASRAGELQLRLTPAAAFVNVTTPSILVETEEILDGEFTRFLKYTQLARTPTATGESDQDLPIGNPYCGILLFGTTFPTSTTVTASLREVRVLMDNQEAYIPRTRWDSLRAQLRMHVSHGSELMNHVHRLAAGAPAGDALVEAAQWSNGSQYAQYGWLEFDPLRDGQYLLPTAGRSRVSLRINADVADAQRIYPIELLTVPGAA